MADDKPVLRQVPVGEYGNQYTGERGTCYVCGICHPKSKLTAFTAHEIFILELYCKATNNNPPRGVTFYCKDRKTCDEWVDKRNNVTKPTIPEPAPAKPWPLPLHPTPTKKRSRTKYG